MNTDRTTFPVQKIPMSKKTKKWGEDSLDAVVSLLSGGSYLNEDYRHDKMRTAYGLYNSEYDENDLKYVTNPYKVKDGFPAKTQNFNIIRPKIDLLIGEESKRPFNMKVIQTNDDVVTKLQEEKKQLLSQYVVSLLDLQTQDDKGKPLTPKEIEKYLKYSYKTVGESTAYHSLNYLKEKLNLTNEFLKGWKDALIAGEEIYYIGSVNGNAVLERVNPLDCGYEKDPDKEQLEDGDKFVRRMDMTPASIYDRFFNIMDESDLDTLLEYANGSGGTFTSTPDQVNSRSVMYKEKFSNKFFGNDDNIELITVWHGVWRSYKKVGFLTIDDLSGETREEMVDETYKVEPGEKIEWEWLPEIWEGYKVGENIYLGIQPLDYQYTSMDDPVNRKLPYCGVVYSNTNTASKSLTMIMEPLQKMYIIIWYRLELALARDKGKIINMDITQIPKGSTGMTMEQWMHYLSALGVNFFNPYDEGWNVPGREGGKAAQFNQFGQIDLTMGDVISEYINLMAKIEEMIGEISGVSRQRQGSIQKTELVGNVERAVIQSSHITEPLFWNHNQAKKSALTLLLNATKNIWQESGKKKLHYVLNDTERIFLDIEDDFLYSDFDIFVSDSTREDQNIRALKSLLQPAMQNGATLLDAAAILSSDNLSRIKITLKDIEQRREEAIAQQQQVEQQQTQIEREIKQEEIRVQEEDSIRKAETQIAVAKIKAATEIASIDIGNVNEVGQIESELEKDKMNLEEDKQKEVERKNKKQESLKQEEINIKRTQANKANKPNNTK